MLSVLRERLQKFAHDLYNIIGLQITFYNKDRRVIVSYPPGSARSAVCALMHKNPATCSLCYKCDREALNIAKFRQEPYIYNCHAGLTEAISQIYENDIFIGYIMIGQFLTEGDEEKARERLLQLELEHGIAGLAESLVSVPKRSREFTESAASIMQACACYITTNKIIKNNADILSMQLTEYINEHLKEELSVKKICRELYISRARLYDITKKVYKRGIMDYVNKLRIDRARILLLTTNMKVYELAAEVGFRDTKYFVRKFKKEIKITPLQFRKLNRGE